MAQAVLVKGGGGTARLSGTAVAGDVLSGKTFYNTDPRTVVTGTIPTYSGATTISPTASAQTVSTLGNYLNSDLTVDGVTNLVASNIKKGVTVGGVVGTFEGQLANTITSQFTYTGTLDSGGNTIINITASAVGLKRIDGIVFFRNNALKSAAYESFTFDITNQGANASIAYYMAWANASYNLVVQFRGYN